MKAIRTIFKNSIKRWWKANPGTLGAALAFYGLFSITPLFSLTLFVFGKIVSVRLLQFQIAAAASAYAGPSIGSIIIRLLRQISLPGGGPAFIISIVMLIFGSLGFFTQIQTSLHRIWNVIAEPTITEFLYEKVITFFIFIGLGIILVGSFLASLMLNFFRTLVFSHIHNHFLQQLLPVSPLIAFISSILIIAFLYSYLPRAKLGLVTVWTGSIITALFWLFGNYILQLYVSYISVSSAYGAIGTLAILLLWMYYSAQIFFFGAAWTYSLGDYLRLHRHGTTTT